MHGGLEGDAWGWANLAWGIGGLALIYFMLRKPTGARAATRGVRGIAGCGACQQRY